MKVLNCPKWEVERGNCAHQLVFKRFRGIGDGICLKGFFGGGFLLPVSQKAARDSDPNCDRH